MLNIEHNKVIEKNKSDFDKQNPYPLYVFGNLIIRD